MSSFIVRVGSVGEILHLRRCKSLLTSSSSYCGGCPLSVCWCAGEVVSQEKSLDSGGMVHGVPCADPKCCIFLVIRRSVMSLLSVSSLQSVACFGGVSSVGTSICVTSEW